MRSYVTASVIWHGAILGTIAKSVATAINAEFDTFQSWSGNNYIVQGWDGRYGAITFEGPQGRIFQPRECAVVGAFYSVKSDRCPLIGESCHAILESVFRGCPEHHRRLADTGALQFLLFEAHLCGPCATTAFWSDDDCLVAADAWSVALENGMDLIRIQLIENVKEALGAWAEEYLLSETQIDLVRSIYRRKTSESEREIRLGDSEAAYLSSLSDDPTAFQICKVSFADIGVIVP